MPKKGPPVSVAVEQIERQIYIVRGQRIMLDSDLAQLYGITTMAFNQAVKRNPARFPRDFAFQLTVQEFRDLISQNVISKVGRGSFQSPEPSADPQPPQP
jgi:hypothetical protein